MHYLDLLWANLGVVSVGFVAGMYFRERVLGVLHKLLGWL